MKQHQIAVHFPAGGTAKSTTVWALASYLSLKFRVLVIDLDPQGSVSNSLSEEFPSITAYEVLRKEASIEDAITATLPDYPENLFVVTASSKLAALEVETAAIIDRHYALADALEGLEGFDFVIADTPPAGNINTVCALTGHHVLAPITSDPKGYDQIPTFESLVASVRRRINPGLEILGIVPTRHEHTVIARETLTALQGRFGDLLFSPIHKTVRLTEAMAQGLPPWHQPSTDYLKLTNSILRRLNHEQQILEKDCFTKGS